MTESLDSAQERRVRIIDRLGTLQSLPAASAEALRLAHETDTDAQALSRAIEQDPGMAANVLRLANSARFGANRQIASIRQAVVRLGRKQIAHIVTGAVAANLSRQEVRGYDLPEGALWQHAVAVAAGAEALAQILGRPAPDEVFTAALLHDVGKLALGSFVEEEGERLKAQAFRTGASFETAERAVLGIDHAEAGALLLEGWHLPSVILQTVRWHHEPECATENGTTVELVHAANTLSMLAGIGTGADGLQHAASEQTIERLGLDIHVAEAALCRMLGALETLNNSFEIASGR